MRSWFLPLRAHCMRSWFLRLCLHSWFPPLCVHAMPSSCGGVRDRFQLGPQLHGARRERHVEGRDGRGRVQPAELPHDWLHERAVQAARKERQGEEIAKDVQGNWA